MNELMANHQNVISQKDKQLADYQKQVDTLQKAENELTKQIEEQKAKNNVSWLTCDLLCNPGWWNWKFFAGINEIELFFEGRRILGKSAKEFSTSSWTSLQLDMKRRDYQSCVWKTTITFFMIAEKQT